LVQNLSILGHDQLCRFVAAKDDVVHERDPGCSCGISRRLVIGSNVSAGSAAQAVATVAALEERRT
jgi:hypothetical protein